MEIDISQNGIYFTESETKTEKYYKRDILDKDEETEDEKVSEEKEFEPSGEPLISFDYDIKNSEEEEAFTVFQKKYVYKRNYVITALFAVVAVMFLVQVLFLLLCQWRNCLDLYMTRMVTQLMALL